MARDDLRLLIDAWRREATRLETSSANQAKAAPKNAARLTGQAEALRRCADAIERLLAAGGQP
jgi:hypothetical protein